MNIEILLENSSVLLSIKRLMKACSTGDKTNHYRRAIKSADWEGLNIYVHECENDQLFKGPSRMQSQWKVEYDRFCGSGDTWGPSQ